MEEKLKVQTNKRIKQLFNTNLINEKFKEIGPMDIDYTQGIFTSRRRKPSININSIAKEKLLTNIMKKFPGKSK